MRWGVSLPKESPLWVKILKINTIGIYKYDLNLLFRIGIAVSLSHLNQPFALPVHKKSPEYNDSIV